MRLYIDLRESDSGARETGRDRIVVEGSLRQVEMLKHVIRAAVEQSKLVRIQTGPDEKSKVQNPESKVGEEKKEETKSNHQDTKTPKEIEEAQKALNAALERLG